MWIGAYKEPITQSKVEMHIGFCSDFLDQHVDKLQIYTDHRTQTKINLSQICIDHKRNNV